ncbi:N-6 DNA methylase [Stenotrophomonas rhizophila]|uniref:N-6 DNA methylase n=1 Tax=Stenotrophomonas rhizophila TaxID=216778 RepID=UPI0010C0D210|nr:N-6 DNA methylase [Stenotrophomonas rhizophila]TKK05965.1 type I restriction endonuclease subunit M [Stenotrophomonas rhizophila]
MASVKTETETVIKRILPYLQRRGYDPVQDFDYETGVASTTRYKQGYVDILVLGAGKKPAFLVEAKRSSRRLNAKDVAQAMDYGKSVKVSFVVVTNGADIQCYNVANGQAIRWDGKLEGKIPSKTQLPTVLKSLRVTPDLTDIPLSKDATLPFRPGLPLKQLNALFARCHSTIRKIEKNEEYAFSDFSKLLFLKLLEEKADVDPAASLPYSYLFHELAVKPDRESDQVKVAILSMINHIKSKRNYGDVLNDEIHLKQPKTFHYIVKQLSAVSFEDSGLDYKGAAFEYFVRATLKGKKLGQYFTPRPLVELMTRLVGKEAIVTAAIAGVPTKVLDPACGTGGFLVFMLKQGLSQLKAKLDSRSISKAVHDAAAQRLKAEIFFGSDANEGVAAAAKMNMIIAGDGHTNIYAEDSLRVESSCWSVSDPQCDYILTNPPFGTSEADSLPSSEMSQFPVRSMKGQNLFLQKMVLSTKPGGYICTVIDEGVLNTDSSVELRKFMLAECRLRLVVQLPDETFKPNKINVRSSIIMLERRSEADSQFEDKYQVTFCKLESLGYDGSGDKLRGFDSDRLFAEFESRVMDVSLGARAGEHWSAFDVDSIELTKDLRARFDLKYWAPEVKSRLKNLAASGASKIKSLNKVVTRRGKSPSAELYVDERDGYALVVKAGSNVSSHGLLQREGADYIEKAVYDDLPDSCKLQLGDVLLSSTGDGTLGKACVYDLDMPAIADGHVTILRVNPKEVDPYFLADYLRCGFGARQVARLYTGSTGLIELTPDRVDEVLIPKMKILDQKKTSRDVRSAESKYRAELEAAEQHLSSARTTFAGP